MPQVKQYSLTVQGKDLASDWQEVIEVWSDDAAIAHAKRQTRRFACCDWFHSITLRDDDGVIAEFTLGEIEVELKYHRVYKE